MFRSILVPLDGSSFSEHALPLALTVARRAGATVRFVHVHAPPDPKHPDWYLPPDQRSDPGAVQAQAAYLEGVVRRARAAGVAAAMDVVEGTTVPALCAHAARCGSDLVVMTTHGRGPLSRFWLGSVADGLVRQLTAPVLLVRPDERPVDLTADVCLRHFLIPLDGSRHAEAILEPALTLGEATGAAYTLLRVVEPVPLVGYDVIGYAQAGTDVTLMDHLRRQATEYLDAVAERLRARGLHAQPRVQINLSAAEAILNDADARPHDLVALETHGRHGASRLLLGSVADKVIRGATLPVLVHRSPEPADAPAATESAACVSHI